MNLLRKVAIIGALTIGGSVFSYTVGSITPASAECQFIQKVSSVFDDWQCKTIFYFTIMQTSYKN